MAAFETQEVKNALQQETLKPGEQLMHWAVGFDAPRLYHAVLFMVVLVILWWLLVSQFIVEGRSLTYIILVAAGSHLF